MIDTILYNETARLNATEVVGDLELQISDDIATWATNRFKGIEGVSMIRVTKLYWKEVHGIG